jgi:hypothetical protein
MLDLAVRVDQQAGSHGEVACIGRDVPGCVVKRAVRLTERDLGVAAVALNQRAMVIVQVRYIQGQLARAQGAPPVMQCLARHGVRRHAQNPCRVHAGIPRGDVAAGGGDGDICGAALAAAKVNRRAAQRHVGRCPNRNSKDRPGS